VKETESNINLKAVAIYLLDIIAHHMIYRYISVR